MNRARFTMLLTCVVIVIALVTSGCGEDQSDVAWQQADRVMAEQHPGAYLVSIGSGGLALADQPHEWSFVYYDPSDRSMWLVFIHEGSEPTVRTIGESKAVVSDPFDSNEIQVTPDRAVRLAREFADDLGITLPPNVMVGGALAEMEGGEALGMVPGMWTVTFAAGTDTSDARTFAVDMFTGDVTDLNADTGTPAGGTD